MERFIPVSEDTRIRVEESLKNSHFGTVESFISFYNNDLINKRSEQVKSLLAEIVASYKDVEEKSGKIIFLEPGEIYLSEVLTALEPWELVTKLKREVIRALDEGILQEDEIIAFTDKSTGVLGKIRVDEEGKRYFEKIGVEKMFTKPDALEDVFRKFSHQNEGGKEGTYFFNVSDFTDIDDSFLREIHQLLPR